MKKDWLKKLPQKSPFRLNVQVVEVPSAKLTAPSSVDGTAADSNKVNREEDEEESDGEEPASLTSVSAPLWRAG
jgi:hypothetical protein